ncbi:MAG: lipoprotein insertase outer membrane protein LolB [Granulosicoccus sp.]
MNVTSLTARATVQRVSLVWALVLSLLLVSSCTVTPTTSTIDPVVRAAKLAELSEFSFSGGLGIWTDEQSISGRLLWQQAGDKLDVRLTGPLGLGEMDLSDSGDFATLDRAGTVLSSGPSVDRVLQEGLGLAIPVPLEQLKRWVLGLPGDALSVDNDTQGKLSSLRFTDQQGTRWQVHFRRYTELEGLALPSLITASGGPYSVRLLLKNWQPSVNSVQPVKKQPNTRLAIPGR